MSSSPPTDTPSGGGTGGTTLLHTTETITSRFKSREEAAQRASGQLPPQTDIKTGQIINPHNPEFITKRPWYLGGSANDGPSLDHQANQLDENDRLELSLKEADKLVEQQRLYIKSLKRNNKFKVGMWVEALKKNKRPYRICQIIKIAKKGTLFDVKYEDGSVETCVKMKKADRLTKYARIRMTKSGNRSFVVDHSVSGKETYDSKRDKYHGYDMQHHLDSLKVKFAERDAIRKKLRLIKQQQEQQQQQSNENDNENDENNNHKSNQKKKKDKQDIPSNSDSDDDSDYDSDAGSDSDDEFVQRDEDDKVHTSRLARQGGVGGQQLKVTARNLRIREDTAKYLHNLDTNSAYYDPKSRSMRDNPNVGVDANEVDFAGDNFARISGDAVGLAQTQVFAWDVEKNTGGSGAAGGGGSGGNAEATPASSIIHPQANPSLAETLRKEFTNKEADLKHKRKKDVLDKYGGAEYLDGDEGLGSATVKITSTTTSSSKYENQRIDAIALEKEKEKAFNARKARFGVTVQEEHYNRDGRLKNTSAASSKQMMMNQKSKYEEDVYTNGHSTVWGSYFHKGAFKWGYADDHSLIKNAYCTGDAGRLANDEANEMRYGTGVAGSAALAQAREMLKAIPQTERNTSTALNTRPTSSSMYGEADQFKELDKDKLKAAMQKEEVKNKIIDDKKKKRKYNSVDADIDVTAEEMEAYRLKKERSDDPLTKLADTEELLEYKQ